jgi:hypothetical protein
MTRWENILRAYRAGALTLKGAEVEIAAEITPENVDQVMAQLPPEIIGELSRWAGGDPGLVIANNLSSDGAKRLRAKLDQAQPVLRAWFERHANLQQSQPVPALNPQSEIHNEPA